MAEKLRKEYFEWYRALTACPTASPDVAEQHRVAAQERFRESLPFLESLPLEATDHVLDVGMGYGFHCRWFVERCEHVKGIADHVPERVRADAEQFGYDVEEADMHSTGLQGERFDLVWSHHCLEHSFSPFAALLEWRRVLRPGGRLAVTVPPHKTEVVSGHFVVGWNIGQLLYLLGCTGYDIQHGRFLRAGYNVRAVVGKDPDFDPRGKSYLYALKDRLPPGLQEHIEPLPRSLGGYALEGELLAVHGCEVVRAPGEGAARDKHRSPVLSRLLRRLVNAFRR
jgi:SAM-dependent methyltransferase